MHQTEVFLLEEPGNDDVSFCRSISLDSPLLTRDSNSRDIETLPPQLTAATLARLARLGSHSKAQLKTWWHTEERHEQIALGQKTSESKATTEQGLEDVENKIYGSGRK